MAEYLQLCFYDKRSMDLIEVVDLIGYEPHNNSIPGFQYAGPDVQDTNEKKIQYNFKMNKSAWIRLNAFVMNCKRHEEHKFGVCCALQSDKGRLKYFDHMYIRLFTCHPQHEIMTRKVKVVGVLLGFRNEECDVA